MNPNTLCVGCMESDSGEPLCPACGRAFDLEPKSALQLRPRTILREQYLIGRTLGHGGFGITYLAWDLGLESRLAIKEYMPNGVAGRASNETKVHAYSEQTQQEFTWGLDRFLEEARVLKKFATHTGIVSVDTVFRDNNTAYLVMEFLDGMTFEEFLNRRGGKITFETALRVMLPVLDALSAVHAEGILHRDISPDNIHLTRDGKIKLIDFGAARNALSQKSRNLSIILKEGYAPEEQYRASGVQGPWTDVYASAATLYHAITGQVPPPSLDRQAEDTLKRPSELGVEIERHAEAALMKALSIRAADRFQSMEDFKGGLTGAINVIEATRAISANDPRLQALNIAPPPPPPPAIVRTGGPPPPPPAPPAAMHFAATRKPRWMWPAILAVAAAISVGVAIKYGPSDDGDTGPVISKNDPPPKNNDTPPPQNNDTPPPNNGNPPPNNNDNPPPRNNDNPPPGNNEQPPRDLDPERKGNPPPRNNDTPPPRDNPPPSNNDTPPPPSGGGSYADLLAQAKQLSNRNQWNQAMQVLNRAIQMDGSKPEAYNALAEIQLYNYNQIGQAVQNYKAALDRGGVATFHVAHDHRGTNFAQACRGWLHVSRNSVRFEGFDSLHRFSAQRAGIKEAKKNRFPGLGIPGTNGNVNLQPFHIRLTSGDPDNWNLAPLSNYPQQETDLILGIIDKD